MQEHHHIYKWTSKSEYVDVETGEILTKKIAVRDYQIIKKEKIITITELYNVKYGTIIWSNWCQRSNQYRIF